MLDTNAIAALDAIEMAMALEMNQAIQQPTIIWGPPGIAKSALVMQLAAKLNMPVLDIRALTRNPADVNGLPFVLFDNGAKPPSRDPTATDKVGYTVWSRPDLVPQDGEGILFLDELPAGAPEIQASLYQLILDRCIGPHKLGDGWTIFCAGNRMSDRGHVWPMPSPLSDRLQHYDLVCKLAPWLQWASANDIHPMVTGYLNLRDKYDIEDTNVQGNARTASDPNPLATAAVASALPTYRQAPPKLSTVVIPDHCGMLLRFDPKERSFPTPRSWHKVSNALYEIERRGLTDSKIEFSTVAGKVGMVAATELLAFAKLFRQGFSISTIIANPDTAPEPQDAGMRCAVASALARNATKANIAKIYRYADRALPEEFMCMMMDDAERRHKDLTATAAYRDYGIKYAAARGGAVT